jgi:aminopeptidase-like protein
MRFLILPETIGTIAYLKENLIKLKDNFYAGYVLTCLGDKGEMSFLKSIDENSISNKVAKNYFKKNRVKVKYYNFMHRGSDERQYNSPRINLNMASIMRTKYGKYKEYHTSLDNLNFIKLKKLKQSTYVITKILQSIQSNIVPEIKTFCEPHLSKYGLYPTLSRKNMSKEYNNLLNFLAYANGKRNLYELSDILKLPYLKILKIYKLLKKKKIVI